MCIKREEEELVVQREMEVQEEEKEVVLVRSVCSVSADDGDAAFGLVGREASLQSVGRATGEESDCVCLCLHCSLRPPADSQHPSSHCCSQEAGGCGQAGPVLPAWAEPGGGQS